MGTALKSAPLHRDTVTDDVRAHTRRHAPCASHASHCHWPQSPIAGCDGAFFARYDVDELSAGAFAMNGVEGALYPGGAGRAGRRAAGLRQGPGGAPRPTGGALAGHSIRAAPFPRGPVR